MIPMFDYYKKRHDLHSTDEIKPGLAAIEEAMKRLHDPQLAVPTVHVAGTNGKGSTIKMLEKICQEHQLKTAVFISPCIEDVHDQIQFDGQPITEQQMDAAFQEAKACQLDYVLTDFELLTAIAFIAIKQQAVDIAIIESGMGGRFDSTNTVKPLVSIIPSIALEHTRFLGNTIEKIAWHKAGIIKEHTAAVIGKLPQEACAVMQEQAQLMHAPLYENGVDFTIDEQGEWRGASKVITQLSPSLKGPHQQQNMALAIQSFFIIAQTLSVKPNDEAIRHAVATTALAGRFEQIAKQVWLDGAHNPASAKTLSETMRQQFPNEKWIIVLGILKDKDVVGVLRELEEVADDFVFVEVEREKNRLMAPAELLSLSHAKQTAISSSVLETVKEKSQEHKVLVTGSLYLLAQWRTILLENL